MAKVCSDLEKPRGLVAMSIEQACERFAQAPPSLVPGIGPKTAERLRTLGITTLQGLREADPEALRARFGPRHGNDLVARAGFIGSTTLSEQRETVSRSNERTFDADIADRDEMERVLQRLADGLCETLRRKEARGRTISIKVRLDDFTTVTRARTIAQPVDDARPWAPSPASSCAPTGRHAPSACSACAWPASSPRARSQPRTPSSSAWRS